MKSMSNFGNDEPEAHRQNSEIGERTVGSVAPISSHVGCEVLDNLREPACHSEHEHPRDHGDHGAKPMAVKLHVPTARDRYEDDANDVTRYNRNAPAGAPAPSAVSATHRRAWAAAPTAIGQAIICRGVE